MEFEAAVSYGSGNALFRISRENPGIYNAVLLSFDGNNNQHVPAAITLIRGIRGWTGSENDDILINELGHFIELHTTSSVGNKVI